MHFTPHGSIHVTPGGDMRPHLTACVAPSQVGHVPYHGQTTVDMFGRPDFDPRPQWENIVANELGTLYELGATPG